MVNLPFGSFKLANKIYASSLLDIIKKDIKK